MRSKLLTALHQIEGRMSSTPFFDTSASAHADTGTPTSSATHVAGLNEAAPTERPAGPHHAAGADQSPQMALTVQAAVGYAGDVSPQLAYQWWRAGEAVLVDVRSDAEREWVGFVPDAIPVAWKQWPGMAPNAQFDAGVQAASQGKKLLLLCRSGVRSIAAAKRATELGLQAYNISEGFEGDPDSHGQRGRVGGWRFHGLPWRQS